jgi:2-polyprenyl-3-methyl-5-hydroxy-6-metoxy-1,4-benzoquinol methylase
MPLGTASRQENTSGLTVGAAIAMRTTLFHQGMHCEASDILPAIDACPICMSTEPRESVFQIQRSPDIVMLKCGKCRGCSASHMPTDDLLARYYSRYYADSELKTTTSNAGYFARHVTAPMTGLAGSRPLRILDYGGGDGSLSCAIASRLLGKSRDGHIDIDLVDFESPCASRDGRITIRGCKDIDEVESDYDLIIASAILEHVPRLHGVIRRLAGSARPGAYFYARTPFMIPMTRLIRKLDLTYPAHVHDMGSSFWNRFVRTFELKAETIVSRPSLIETTFLEAPLRTLAAFAMKLPSHLELAVRRPPPIDPFWSLVGGWEVVLRFHE